MSDGGAEAEAALRNLDAHLGEGEELSKFYAELDKLRAQLADLATWIERRGGWFRSRRR